MSAGARYRAAMARVEAELAALRAELLAGFEADAVQYSKGVKAPVIGVIAMGRWYIQRVVDEDAGERASEMRLPSIQRIDDCVGYFGNGAIPGPIRIVCQSGIVTDRREDW